jgi:hypothetical protein
MNISWTDLNNVKEPGDYPFRNGTINVSFREIAVWKKNTGAQFRLMRVHPIRTVVRYILGEEVAEAFAAVNEKLVYESGNGDSWWLFRDPATEEQAVIHRANLQSGGHISTIEVGKFLSSGANGPEHQALRQLMELNQRRATILIAYDIHHLKGELSDDLANAIRTLGSWWHHLESVWIVQCAFTPGQVRDRLKSYIGGEDQLLVVDISGDAAEWSGVNNSGTEWLRANI